MGRPWAFFLGTPTSSPSLEIVTSKNFFVINAILNSVLNSWAFPSHYVECECCVFVSVNLCPHVRVRVGTCSPPCFVGWTVPSHHVSARLCFSVSLWLCCHVSVRVGLARGSLSRRENCWELLLSKSIIITGVCDLFILVYSHALETIKKNY